MANVGKPFDADRIDIMGCLDPEYAHSFLLSFFRARNQNYVIDMDILWGLLIK